MRMIGSRQLKYLDRNTERGYTDKESAIFLSVSLSVEMSCAHCDQSFALADRKDKLIAEVFRTPTVQSTDQSHRV
jgi:hypothetical protein